MTYPSDVDAFEVYEVENTATRASSLCARALKRLAARVEGEKDAFWVEAKIGRDLRYALPACEYEGGILSYDVKKVKAHIESMRTSGLLSAKEARTWKSKVKADVTYSQYVEFQDLFYKHLVLRWSAEEVLQGQKTLGDGTSISLEDAILSGGDIKVDGIIYLAGDSGGGARWVEVSNYVILKARGRAISTDPFVRNLGSSIAFDILGYLDPKKHKAMKIAKRLWSISTYLKDTNSLYLLSPLMSSDAARLHQLQGSIEAGGTLETRRREVKRDLLALTDKSLAQIDNPSFLSDDEKAVLRKVVASGDYENAAELLSIKTDGYARTYLDVTGLMTTVISTVIDNAKLFQVCERF
jgi:hypothetical protein